MIEIKITGDRNSGKTRLLLILKTVLPLFGYHVKNVKLQGPRLDKMVNTMRQFEVEQRVNIPEVRTTNISLIEEDTVPR